MFVSCAGWGGGTQMLMSKWLYLEDQASNLKAQDLGIWSWLNRFLNTYPSPQRVTLPVHKNALYCRSKQWTDTGGAASEDAGSEQPANRSWADQGCFANNLRGTHPWRLQVSPQARSGSVLKLKAGISSHVCVEQSFVTMMTIWVQLLDTSLLHN